MILHRIKPTRTYNKTKFTATQSNIAHLTATQSSIAHLTATQTIIAHLKPDTTPAGSLGGTADNVFERLHSQPDEPPPEGNIVRLSPSPTNNETISCIRFSFKHRI